MLEIIDDQCRDPSVEEKDHLAGQNYYEPNAPLKYDERVVQSAKGVTGKGDTLNFSPQKNITFLHTLGSIHKRIEEGTLCVSLC